MYPWEEIEKIIENISEELGEQEIYKLLKSTTFFKEPASSKFHHCYKGGLARHSLSVYFNFLRLCKAYDIEDKKFAFRISMLHDLCKIGTYQSIYPEEYKKIAFPEPVLGHGDSSIFISLKGGIELNNEEMACIKWHLACPSDHYEEKNRYEQVKNKYIRLSLFQQADYLDSRFPDLVQDEIKKHEKLLYPRNES